MKKKKHRSKMGQSEAANDESKSNEVSLQQDSAANEDGDTNQGFSDWLQSPEGWVLRCFFMIALIGWYSASVWRTMDAYFRDEFKKYLAKERDSNNLLQNYVSSNEKFETIHHNSEGDPAHDIEKHENGPNINHEKITNNLEDSKKKINADEQLHINDGKRSMLNTHKSKLQLNPDWTTGSVIDDEYCSLMDTTNNEIECDYMP